MNFTSAYDQTSRSVTVPTDGVELAGELKIPFGSRGLVLMPYGSDGSRQSERELDFARALRRAGLGTLALDLLVADEIEYHAWRADLHFTIDLLAGRLAAATDWLIADATMRDLPLGYFGSNLVSAALFVAAAERAPFVRAIVSRGGRPDLVRSVLSELRAPTLLLMGHDDPALEGNKEALAHMGAEARLEVVREATHLFPEPLGIEKASALAADWFAKHLR